jgi:hypothetical protein
MTQGSDPPKFHGAPRVLLIAVLLVMLFGFGSLSLCGGIMTVMSIREAQGGYSGGLPFLFIALPALLICGWAAVKVLLRLVSLIRQRP